MVAVGVGGTAVDESEHGQMLGLKFAWRIDQHPFDSGAVVGLPSVGLALGKFAFGEEFVEGRDGTRLVKLSGAFGEIDFGRFLQRRIDKGDAGRVERSGDGLVRAFPSVEFVQGLSRLGDGICGYFGASAGAGEHSVSGHGVAVDWTDEVLAPLLDGTSVAIGLFAGGLFTVRLFAVEPVEMRLQVAIWSGYVSDFDDEKYVAIVVGPAQCAFDGLIVG